MSRRVPRGSVVGCLTRNPGVLGSSRTTSSWFFRGSVLGQDTSEPRKAWIMWAVAWYDWNTVKSGVKHHSINQSIQMSRILIKESNYVKFITIHPKWLELWPRNIHTDVCTYRNSHCDNYILLTASGINNNKTRVHGLKLLINNTTMKFHEILTKAKSDIRKNLNFTREPLFPWQSVVKKLNQILIKIGILQESPIFHGRASNWKKTKKHIDKNKGTW